jgi:hypothetical protein
LGSTRSARRDQLLNLTNLGFRHLEFSLHIALKQEAEGHRSPTHHHSRSALSRSRTLSGTALAGATLRENCDRHQSRQHRHSYSSFHL